MVAMLDSSPSVCKDVEVRLLPRSLEFILSLKSNKIYFLIFFFDKIEFKQKLVYNIYNKLIKFIGFIIY